MDKRIIKPYVEKYFSTNILPSLIDYIKIPNCSPLYDPDWETNGHAMDAVNLMANWVKNQDLKNCTVNILKEKGHTAFLYIDITSTLDTNVDNSKSILLYGHYDKQPPLDGWSPGLGPYKPVIKGNLLYGRGASDDGYALYSAVTAVKACQDNNCPIPRIIILIEGAEESNTIDLLFYLKSLKDTIGDPSLIMCLDSGVYDFNRLWVTSSLRGLLSLNLKVAVVSDGVSSGVGGGLVPDSFMIVRSLLSRLEDCKTGDIKDSNLCCDLPEDRSQEIDELIKVVGKEIFKMIPYYGNITPLDKDLKDTLVRESWRPMLAITGCAGLNSNNEDSNSFSTTDSNTIRPFTELRLSIRLPPIVNSSKAGESVKSLLESNPPFNANVNAKVVAAADGWNLKGVTERTRNILNIASQRFFSNDLAYRCEGGSIPFVKIIEGIFTKSDMLVLGVNGPSTNMHGPDENLNMDYCKKLIMCMTYIISEH